MTLPGEGFAVRLEMLERQVRHLESLEPAVVKSQVEDIKRDIHQLSEDLGAIRKILIGFLVTFATASASTTVAIVLLVTGP